MSQAPQMLGYRSWREDRFASSRRERLIAGGFLALSFLSFAVSLLATAILTVSILRLFGYDSDSGHRRFVIAAFGVILIKSVILGCLAFQFSIRHWRAAEPMRPLL